MASQNQADLIEEVLKKISKSNKINKCPVCAKFNMPVCMCRKGKMTSQEEADAFLKALEQGHIPTSPDNRLYWGPLSLYKMYRNDLVSMTWSLHPELMALPANEETHTQEFMNWVYQFFIGWIAELQQKGIKIDPLLFQAMLKGNQLIIVMPKAYEQEFNQRLAAFVRAGMGASFMMALGAGKALGSAITEQQDQQRKSTFGTPVKPLENPVVQEDRVRKGPPRPSWFNTRL